MKKLRVMWTGAGPWTPSGYGKPLKYVIPRLYRAGYAQALCAFFGWGGAVTDTEVDGALLTIYPSAKDGYFNDIIQHHVASFKADVVITLQDVWILHDWGSKGFPWCPWLPIDTHPVSPAIVKAIEGCHTPLVWVDWAKRELEGAGWMNTRTIPFGVDLDVYKPQDKEASRLAVGLPDDGRFIAGMVAANSSYPSRKSFPEVLIAFKQYMDRGGTGMLYLHTTITPKGRAGIDLMGVLQSLGIPWSTLDDPDPERVECAKVMFPSQHKMWCGAYSETALADIYNSLDLYLAPSMAEGFGIPILEAQACGIPVITTNNTSMPELTFNGRCLEPAQPAWEAEGGWRHVPSVGSIMDALECGEGGDFERRVPDEVAAFSWDVVVERGFLPFLAELEEELC